MSSFSIADCQPALKRQLTASWDDAHAHLPFDAALANIPPELRGAQPPGQPFTLWRLLEHQRLCILDFLDCCRVPGYIEPPVSEGVWPATGAPPNDAAWDASLAACRRLRQEFLALIQAPATDLFAPIPGSWSPPRNILRQVLACQSHTAYHLGQIVLLRRHLGLT